MNNINVKKMEDCQGIGVVYDISMDGTVVNALGMNVISNTDGFNFRKPNKFRYTDEHPYISNGGGRNSIKGKAYTGVDADVAEFEDLYFNSAYNGGINKSGLGIDEYCDACIQFSRKNYADLMPDGSIKKVGNTIKSRKMSGYLERFIDDAVVMLLHGEGSKFINFYYDYLERIYNYQIPIKDIASKGNIKKSIAEYVADCKTLTKTGAKKSRQAWYELVLKDKMDVNVGETIYYINTGTKKGHSDVKRVTHVYVLDENGVEVEAIGKVKSWIFSKEMQNYGASKLSDLSTAQKKEILSKYTVREEDEIILNCKMVPSDILNSDDNIMCSDVDGLEYNSEKYIDQFNKRVRPLLVCFSPDIREKILVTNPDDRKYFTEEESALVAGYPDNEGDQDKYEDLMTPERKEIEFWLRIGEVPPFIKECGIDWDGLVRKHKELLKAEEDALFKEEDGKYINALENLTAEDYRAFEEDGIIPKSISSIVNLGSDMKFRFNKIPEMRPSTGGYIFEDINSENRFDLIDDL